VRHRACHSALVRADSPWQLPPGNHSKLDMQVHPKKPSQATEADAQHVAQQMAPADLALLCPR
jgi:hypothetical protein